MELILGNLNYSSWSIRVWLTATTFDLPFDLTMVWLEDEGAPAIKRRHSPTGRVPVLRDGELRVWDSLAICEYLAERYPERGLWPAPIADRAVARSLAAEMHAGFSQLRACLPQNLRATKACPDLGGDAAAELERMTQIFSSARGPFLFGGFCIADAFFAPVAARFQTYGVELAGAAAEYRDQLLGHPPMRTLLRLAAIEGHPEPAYD